MTTQNTEKIRIAKFLSHAGICSRRDAEKLIAEGRVQLNGATLDTPAVKVGPDDKILVNGQSVDAPERTRIFLHYKKTGIVTTHRDEKGRSTVFDKLPTGMPRVISVGRLDINTEGLLILTNDGDLARLLELPDTGWKRRYRVRARGWITQKKLDVLKKGITIECVKYGPIEATLDETGTSQKANCWITLSLSEGKNREVRNVMTHLGLEVNRLIRMSYGPFQLGGMKPGDVKELPPKILKDQLPAEYREKVV